MERFENHEYLLAGALDATLSSAESDTFALLLQSSPVLQREYAELRQVETMLLLHAHAETAATAAFREGLRSQLRSSLPASVQVSKPSYLRYFLLGLFALLVVGAGLWWKSLPADAVGTQIASTDSHNQVSSAKEYQSRATKEHSQPTQAEHSVAKHSEQSVHNQSATITTSENVRHEETTQQRHPAPTPSDSLAGNIQSQQEQQLQQQLENTTTLIQRSVQNGNIYAAATNAKRAALLCESMGDVTTARTWFTKALHYAHESGIREQEGEINGEAALFEARHSQIQKAKGLREQCLKLLENTPSRTRWENNLRHIQ